MASPLLVVEHMAPLERLLTLGLREQGLDAITVPRSDAPRDIASEPLRAIVLNTVASAADRHRMTDAFRVLTPYAGIVELVPDTDEYEATEADGYIFEPNPLPQLLSWLERETAPWETSEGRESLRQHAAAARETAQRLRYQAREIQKNSRIQREAAHRIWIALRSGQPLR